ncbi:MAG: FAD-dependent monooxygenase, partial [Candidatus Saccharibacteria bacterium]|nr:FAD-dependent monooxygenase [Pseudorhodobacter sp.]
QKALTFAVTHPVPHQNVSTEIHRSGGPFTLVPLPARAGLPCSAVVWMETGPEVWRLHALPVAQFEAAIDARSCGVLGPLTLVTKRLVWPMIAQLADRMTGERVALMAEAAHVVPPIGAQGLNMSLADLAALLELAGTHDLGSEAMLAAYHRRRYPDIRTRVMGIDALNRASMVQMPMLRDMRAAALSGLYAMTPVRKTLMKAGLGAQDQRLP